MSVPSPQSVLPEQTVLNIQENHGQVAIGQYVVQIGSVHGGVVNISMPEQQPALQALAVADPALLPPPPELILDRVAETETAARALQAGQVIEFTGEGGIGKTTLLEYLAHHPMAQAFPNGAVYLSARRKLAEDLLQELFDAFHEASPNQALTLKPTHIQIQRALRDKKLLLILDDAHLERDELKELRRLAPGCTLLLGSPERHMWRRGEGQALTLPGLPLENAVDLLEYELGRPLSTEEHSAAKALCVALDGHPDHLIQAAALVREDNRRLPDLARQIQQAGPKALSGQVVAALPDPQQQVIQALAALNGAPLSVEHLNAITGLADTGPLIEALLRRGIVQAHSPRYSLVGNLGQLVQQQNDLTPWSERALSHFANWAELRQADAGRLLTDLEPILQSLLWGLRHGYWPRVLRLVRALEEALALSRYWGAWNRVLQAGLEAARELGNQVAEAWALHQLGTRALCLGQARLARNFLTQALQMREALGDTMGAAITRHNLSLLLPPLPPTDSQPPADSTPPSTGATTSLLSPLPILIATGAALLPLLLLWWFWNTIFPAPPPETPIAGLPFVTITPTETSTPIPELTPTPTETSSPTSTSTGTPSPTPTSTFIILPSPTSDTPTPVTPTATPVTPTPTPLPPGPEISSVDPGSTEVDRQVTIRVGGNNFEINDGGFRVELLGPDFRTSLALDDIRTRTVFEAIVPANLPVGLYDLQVTNPDNQVAFKPAAFEVFARRLPGVQLLPDRLDFSEQQLNTQSDNRLVTLINTGLADLTINGIILGGAHARDFNLTHSCPTILLSNSSCTLVISFRPSATGSRTATVAITNNAVGSPHTLFLNGVGILRQPDLVITGIETTGQPAPHEDQIELPIRLVVENQGDSAAAIFRLTAEYTGGNLPAGQSQVIPFNAQSTLEIDPREGQAPFTRLVLPAGAEVVFNGVVIFEAEAQGGRVSLSALADSCNGESGQAAFCRVEERNEGNNRSLSLSSLLPRFDPEIFEVNPPTAEIGQSQTLTITGENFRPTETGFRVTLLQGETSADLPLGNLKTETMFEAQVPLTLPVGLYDLRVTNPNEGFATKDDAFNLVPRSEPRPRFVPDHLVFPGQALKTTSEPQTITLTNVGSATLLITQISLAGLHPQDFQREGACPTSLAPGAGCPLTINFSPTLTGQREALLSLDSNAPGSPHTASLGGTGILSQPDLVIEQFRTLGAPAIDPQTGQVNLPAELVVKNQGSVPAAVFAVYLEYSRETVETAQQSGRVPFLIRPTVDTEIHEGQPFTRRPLEPGQTVSFAGAVRFEPQEQGTALSLLARVDSCDAAEGLPPHCRVAEVNEINNLSEPLPVLLPTAPREPKIRLDPGFLLFPDQEVGTRSSSQQVTVANTGLAQLRLDSIKLAGAQPDDFNLDHTCPLSLAPGGACTLTLTFLPLAPGSRNAVVNIIHNAAGSPRQLPLAGLGILRQPDLVITGFELLGPPELVFDTRGDRIDLPLQLVIKNQGDAPAGRFKLSLDYLGGQLAAERPRLVSFQVETNDAIDSGSGSGPLTRQPLTAGAEISFTGVASFDLAEAGQTLALSALADSCQGDEIAAAFCRVAESNEENNQAGPLAIRLPDRLKPEIFSVEPPMAEVNREILITVEGENFRPEEGFQAELLNTTTRAALALGELRREDRFEAVVPATLPVGLYDLRVTNPDGLSALKEAAFEVVEARFPLAQVVPGRLLFPDQEVGTASSAELVTLTNIGSADLLIDAISLSGNHQDDFILDQACSASLAPNGDCALLVSFNPLTGGLRSAVLALETNAPDSPHTVSLSGTGLKGKPDLIITQLAATGPAVVDQASQQVQLPIQFLVKNQGDAPANSFKLSADYLGSKLDPDRSFVVPFQAQPSGDIDGTNSFYPFTSHALAPGVETLVAGTLSFNSIEQNAVVSLSALADSCSGDRLFLPACRVEESNENNNRSELIVLSLPGPQLEVDPTFIDFNDLGEGGPPPITLANTGSGNLNLNIITITGPNSGDFSLDPDAVCPPTLTPGGSCQLEVAFDFPDKDAIAAVTIVSNAPGSPHQVALVYDFTSDPDGCDPDGCLD